MRTKDFDYHLPGELIAQQPAEPRDSCRLLVMDRKDGACSHTIFSSLPSYLRKGDLLVFNNTKVLPARLFTRKKTGGRCEVFFLEQTDEANWKVLVRPGRRIPPGTVLRVEENRDAALLVTAALSGGERLVTAVPGSIAGINEIMDKYGHVPLPHYIGRDDTAADRQAYQTVYASVPGAVAAPTAGLHFTDALMSKLADMTIAATFITLHVGIGTFRPVKVDDPVNHVMHEERFSITPEAAGRIERTRADGGRIIAVGTTVVRVLEHCFSADGKVLPQSGSTNILILPPCQFGRVDALITNFHLPRSTLLMLVSAFGGRENVLNAYNEAAGKAYRFYSYGDAMMIR